jgi:hypothetical protein
MALVGVAYKVLRPGPWAFAGMDEGFQDRLRPELAQRIAAALFHRSEPTLVIFTMHRGLDVDVAPGMQGGGPGEHGADRPRLDDADIDAAAGELDAQGVGIGLQCELRAIVWAAKPEGHEAEHGGVHDDAPAPLPPHHRDHLAGQLVPAEKVCFELGAQHVGAHVLQRPRLGVGAVVEERIEPAVRRHEHRVEGAGDRGLVHIVQEEGGHAIRLKRRNVFRLAGGGEDPPAAGLHALRRATADAG